MSRRKHLVLDVCIILGVLIAYVFSLLGYDWLAHTPGPLPQPDVGTTDDTVVLIRFEELHTVANRLDVKVLVLPDDSMIDHRLQVLTTDTSVRLYPENELGDLQYPVGKLPAQVATTIEAHGNPGAWPFDTYTTDTVQADVLVGAGDNRQYVPARVEVTGSLEGWDISAVRVGESSQTSDRPDNVIITPEEGQGSAGFRPGHLPGADHIADVGLVRGHPDDYRPQKIPTTVRHLVRRDVVRCRAAAHYSPGLAAGGCVD